MRIDAFDDTMHSNDIEAVVEQIRHQRRNRYGAFHICIDEEYPYIALHTNDDVAYLHYFPSDRHPGFLPDVTSSDGVDDEIHFLNLDGSEAGSFYMPRSTLVSIEDVIIAVREFACDGQLPPSIAWLEL